MTENTAAAATADWKKLIETLERQADAYSRFFILLEKKEKALIKSDAKEMQDLVNEERDFAAELENLEDERRQAAAAAGGPDKTTLRDLLDIAPEEFGEELDTVAVRLIGELNKVAIKNKSNAELVGTAMDFFNYMLNLMTSASTPDDGTYESSGRVRQAELKIKSLLNKQV